MFRILLLLVIAGLAACAGPASKEALATRHAIAEAAVEQIGAPYRYGGTDPNGFDCSGLVQYVYSKAGVQLPHGTGDLLKAGTRISYSDIRVGDLLFYSFKDRKHPSTHVAIYMGDDWMIHAPSSGQQVTKIRSDQQPWPKRYIAAIRILP